MLQPELCSGPRTLDLLWDRLCTSLLLWQILRHVISPLAYRASLRKSVPWQPLVPQSGLSIKPRIPVRMKQVLCSQELWAPISLKCVWKRQFLCLACAREPLAQTRLNIHVLSFSVIFKTVSLSHDAESTSCQSKLFKSPIFNHVLSPVRIWQSDQTARKT